jgi:hypothetical protein
MDDFIVHENTFKKDVLQCCQDVNLSLSNENCLTLIYEAIVIGHHISSLRIIKVDPTKVIVIHELKTPQKKKDIRSVLGHARYYSSFNKDFYNIAASLFKLPSKITKFL